MKNIKKNSVTAVLSHIVSVVCGLILPKLILERFGSEVNGLTRSIKQFLGVISFLDLGVGQVVRSAIYRPLREKNWYNLSCVIDSGKKFYKKLALALLVYVAILVTIYPKLINYDFSWYYTATLILSIAISNFAQYYLGVIDEQLIHADQKSYISSYLHIISNVLNILISVFAIRCGASIQTVKLIASIIYLIKPVGINLFVKRYYNIDRKVKYATEPVLQKWNGFAQHISAVILDGTDTIVLTMFSTLANVSVYAVYYLVINSVQQIYQAATSSIHAFAGTLWAEGDSQRIKKVFSITEFILHTVTIFLFICTGLLINEFVLIYTEGLNDANYYQPIFAFVLVTAYGIRCLRTPYNIWILAAGHFRQTQICHIMAALINVTVSLIAVIRFGLIGVAVGTFVAMIYQTLWMAVYTTKNLIDEPLKKLVKQFIADILIVIIAYVLCAAIKASNGGYIGWLFMAVRVAINTFIAIVIVSGIFYKENINLLINKLKDKYNIKIYK